MTVGRDWPPVADAHLDLLTELWHRRHEETPFARHWLPKLRRGGVVLQVCPTFAADLDLLPELALRRTLEQVNAFRRCLRETESQTIDIRWREDLDQLSRENAIGLLLAMEGVEALGYDPSLIDLFWELGVRIVGLTWNRRNAFADGADESGGLSTLGEQLVRRLEHLGAVVDLAHSSQATFRDVLRVTTNAPLIVSHAACRAIFDHPRNLADDQLRSLAAQGGIIGIMLLPFALDPSNPNAARAVDHIEHAVEVMGIDHVCLGSDFMHQLMLATGHRPPPSSNLPSEPDAAALDGIRGPEDYGLLAAALHDRGFKDTDLSALMGGNLLRFLCHLPSGVQ